VIVHANGTGIAASKSASLFESILAKSADSALGESLAHAYTAAREWGGDLAYSGDAAGSTFVFLLQPAEPPPVEEALPEITIVVPEPLQPLILVVDDEPGIRALVAKILRRERYDVVEASTATEAGEVAAAQLRPVELLVTDIMLPDHTGIVLAEQLRNQIAGLKVLYMSGYTQDDRARTGDFPPGSKFLQKPFTLGALVAKVRESLEESNEVDRG
jgi:CheY-like chemotaxis protein